MSFRKELQKLYPLIKNNKPYFFLFSIGSYPHRNESNHEFPKILKYFSNYDREVIRIYIDENYKDQNLNDLKKRLGNDSYIIPLNINRNEYKMILEFCHIIGILNNSLSIIMEFTGIQRIEYENIENKTPYLFITLSDCMGNTDERIYNPIIEENNNQLSFYIPDELNLDVEINKLFKSELTEVCYSKLEFIKCIILNYVFEVKNVYRLILNHIERKDCFDVHHEIVFEKNKSYFYPSLDLLKKRMMGYNYFKTENLINDFLLSESEHLEIYVREKIQILLKLILLFLKNGDMNYINNNFEEIFFDKSQDVYKIICNFEKSLSN